MTETETDWTDLQERANRLASQPARLGERMVYLIAAATRSPLAQALYLQASVAREIEKLFRTYTSIRRELIYPFFRAFWMHATLAHPYDFRTALSFTRRSIETPDNSSINGVKQLLNSMVFCLGATLPPDLADWLANDDKTR